MRLTKGGVRGAIGSSSGAGVRVSLSTKIWCCILGGLMVTIYDAAFARARRASLVEELIEWEQKAEASLRATASRNSGIDTSSAPMIMGHLRENLLYKRLDADTVWTMLLQEASALLQQQQSKDNLGIAMEVGMHRPKQCLEAARAGLEAHCIEPSPASFQRVQKGVAKESLELQQRIHLYQMAAGDISHGTVPFTATGGTGDHVGHFDAWNMKALPSSTSVSDPRHPGAVGTIVQVPTIRLDDIILKQQQERKQQQIKGNAATVFALKVDTQGFEWAVFAGLSQSIQNHQVDYILFEYWPRGMDLLAGRPNACVAVHVLETLVQAGYTIYALPVVAHPRAPSGYKSVVHTRPLEDLGQNCQWYFDLEQQFPSSDYKMGYWSDILAVAPNAPITASAATTPITKLGEALKMQG